MEVELPDGTIAEFPDGTPQETIKAVLQKRFPPKQGRTGAETVGRQLGLTGRYMIEGPANLAATFIGDPANALVNLGISGVNKAAQALTPQTMTETITGERENLVPYLQKPSEMVGPALDAMGFPKPENALERVVGETSKFVTSVPAFSGMAQGLSKAGVAGLESLSQGMGQQLAGATAGGASYGTVKELTDNPFAQAAAGLLGGFTGSMAAAKLAESTGRAAIPTAQEVKNMGSAAYKASADAGAIVRPERISKLATDLQDDLAKLGVDATLHPRSMAALARINQATNENITLEGIDILRRVAGEAARSPDPSDAMMASRIIEKIDDMVSSLKPADVVQGNSDDAVNALLRGRSFWLKARKAELIDDAIERATTRAASTGSGGNVENAIRQNLRRILDSKKLSRGFTKAELAEIRQVVTGSGTQNLLRLVGKLSPQGSGLMAALGIGATAANPAMAAFPAAGAGAKFFADAMTRSGANRLSQNIRGNVTGTLPQKIPLTQILPQVLQLGGQMRLAPGLMGQRLPAVPAIATEPPDRQPQNNQR